MSWSFGQKLSDQPQMLGPTHYDLPVSTLLVLSEASGRYNWPLRSRWPPPVSQYYHLTWVIASRLWDKKGTYCKGQLISCGQFLSDLPWSVCCYLWPLSCNNNFPSWIFPVGVYKAVGVKIILLYCSVGGIYVSICFVLFYNLMWLYISGIMPPHNHDNKPPCRGFPKGGDSPRLG